VVPGGGRCGIRVGQEFRSWREGGSLVFDDTLEHEAWNDTQGTRVVLFVDFVRPLPWPLSAVNQTLLALAGRTPAVRNAQANARRLAARNALS
jgi:beta-hydroxylase